MKIDINNKKRIIIVLSSLSLLGLVGCIDTNSQTSQSQFNQRSAGGQGGPRQAPMAYNDNQYPGRIVGSPQKEFQNGVDNLVSSFMDPLDSQKGLGTVSGVQGDMTGVWFNGRINVSGG